MKKLFFTMMITLFLISVMGCSKEHVSQDEYLRCNETSNGKMAETEDGYFLALDEILFYADKDNLGQWVPVCNKPDCPHEDSTCNAYLPSYNTIWQKDGKLYEVAYGTYNEAPHIFELSMDGSGAKNVYEIPLEVDANNITGFATATFQDAFVIQYGYLDEKGNYKEHLLRLEDDGNGDVQIHTLHEDFGSSFVLSANGYYSIRGNNVVLSSLGLEENGDALKNLCKIDGEKLEPTNLPEEINLIGGYFSDETFTYYKEKEGFYQYNITTGENTLICENQLEDGKGYILSEDCMVECNRYINYTPEQAYLKVYNGNEWIDLDLPEEIANSDDPFFPACVASDRIFFRKNIIGKDATTTAYLYYMMLEEENPEFIYCGEIKRSDTSTIETESSTEEPTTEESSTEKETEADIFAKFEKQVVFDTDDFFVEITDVYLDYKNRLCIDICFENKSDNFYSILGNYNTINGITCITLWGDDVPANRTKTFRVRFEPDVLENSGISEVYDISEFTDIAIALEVVKGDSNVAEKIVHIYPQGKENAIEFTREPQSSDIILVENENVSVIVTGYEEGFVPGDTINVFMKNKTDQMMRVQVNEASANGISAPSDMIFGAFSSYIMPESISLYPITLFDGVPFVANNREPNDSFFKINNITEVEEIEMLLNIKHFDLDEGEIGDDIVYKTFVLNP